jgi:ADP-ribosylglycohydrolase
MSATGPAAGARLSLEGLSVGDAFGELFFQIAPESDTLAALPAGPWRWTDDTHMALSVVEVLEAHGRIEQDALARAFARRYTEQPWRGYAGGAAGLLRRIAGGADWREAAPALFHGGSWGNGAAMRAAPIGGYFAGDPSRAAREAQLSALVTHAHSEGQAGAMAVAAAAALAAASPRASGGEFLKATLAQVPQSRTRSRIETALEIATDQFERAARELGTGYEVAAWDTVPYCLWCAAGSLDDYEQALWRTVKGLGDRDTTCAIVGGIVALSAGGVPPEWRGRREPLPEIPLRSPPDSPRRGPLG